MQCSLFKIRECGTDKEGRKTRDTDLHGDLFKSFVSSAGFSSTDTEIVAIQERLVWPLPNDNLQIRETFLL